MSELPHPVTSPAVAENPLGIKRVHHVEFWVGNAKQAAYFYRKAFGFSQIAYRGLETGSRKRCSYVLRQGTATFVLTGALTPESPVAGHVRRHGDGVRDVALEVEDVDHAFHEAVRRGGVAVSEPKDVADDRGVARHAAIRAYGDTIHSLVASKGFTGPFLPRYAPLDVPGESAGILSIDHVVANVETGKMDAWAEWYKNVMGFRRYLTFDDKDISTEYSALMSIVMANGSTSIRLPINEPAPGRRKSQIQEYLDYYGAPGVQHIALATSDILRTVSALAASGVEFLRVPDGYYDRLSDRVGEIRESIDALRPLGILVDRDEEGYLLQIFTRPVEDRPTLFFEIIQRRGSRGFGKGNFKALFEAIEAEQARRGNL
jgi:4-hydroxyphenylpyruvate dioxygenase